MKPPFDFELLSPLRKAGTPSTGAVAVRWLVRGTRSFALLSGFFSLFVEVNCGADAFRILHSFNAPAGPTGTLLVSDGVIYGITERGGPANAGTLYRVNTDGQGFVVLHNFNDADGREPRAGLVRSGETLYGTTLGGGLFQAGTVFKVQTNGAGFQVLKHFNPSIGEGQQPTGSEPMVLAGNSLYGMTEYSGSSNGVAFGWGTVFRLQTDGTGFAVLKNFPSGPESCPWSGLVLGENTLYGTTSGFAGANLGTVFRLNADGSDYKVLWWFSAGADASFPLSGVVRAGNTLFGTTYYGPSSQYHNSGTVFRINTDGTGFTTLHVFDSSGSWPREGLLLVDGVIYGPTIWGPGNQSYGSIYALTTNGAAFLQLKQFDGTNGSGPSGLALSERQLLGVCGSGGAGEGGVLYALPLPTPYVVRNPRSQTAEAGDEVGFSVRAEGALPLTYELFFNETNMLFASSNSTLILPHVQPAQIGSYRIRVTNLFGSATSAAADLNVIAPVPRRLVPGLVLNGPVGTPVSIQAAFSLVPAPIWTPLETVTITNTEQWYFDHAATLDAVQFYRASPTNALGPPLSLGLHFVPAITLTGTPGGRLRVDYINHFGSIGDWRTLETVTLTSPTQVFYDTTAPNQPQRQYRAVPIF